MACFSVCVVDSITLLEICLHDLASESVTSLSIDLEGVDLCRYGRLSLIQILANKADTIWLIDVTTLGATAFVHLDAEGRSLQAILESKATQKVTQMFCCTWSMYSVLIPDQLFFDVRCDADALWNLYGVTLANVYDLQLLEVAMKRSMGDASSYVTGLGRVIEVYLGAPGEWKKIKNEGLKLFQPELGGTYEIFERCPLDPRIVAYSAQDVALLFELKRALEGRMGRLMPNWRSRVVKASADREAESRKPFQGKGRHRAIAPRF